MPYKSAQLVEYIAKRRLVRKEWITQFKAERGCEQCGEGDPVCLQFHHRDASLKEANVSRAINNGWSEQRIRDEMGKCAVLCANCHLKLHHGRVAER